MHAEIGTLIVATSLIQVANGFFGTFISLRMAIEHFGDMMAGLVLSSYFAGFTLGAVRSGRIIQRIGHIRAYAAFAGAVAAATAAMPLLVQPLAWIVLRAIVGFGCAGVFVTCESWLNAKAQPAERGRVFSIYMVGTFLALAAGQLLIARAEIATNAPFSGIVALFAVALVIVSMARAETPRIAEEVRLRYGELTEAAPVAVAGAFISGLLGGAFYALIPAWMLGEGIGNQTIALFMLMVVLGGLAFQIPVGRISDRFDRRVVLAVLAFGFAIIAVLLSVLPRGLPTVLPEAILLGGFMSTLYPVSVSHAHDRMPADRVVAVSSRLIVISGVGSILGPLIGARAIALFDLEGLLYFLAAAAAVLGLIVGARTMLADAPRQLARPFSILTPQAAPLAHDPFESVEKL